MAVGRWVVVVLPKHYFHIILFWLATYRTVAQQTESVSAIKERNSQIAVFSAFCFCFLKQNNEAEILNQNRLCTINQTKAKNKIPKCENGEEWGSEGERTPSVRYMYYCYFYLTFFFSVSVHVVAAASVAVHIYLMLLHNFFLFVVVW